MKVQTTETPKVQYMIAPRAVAVRQMAAIGAEQTRPGSR